MRRTLSFHVSHFALVGVLLAAPAAVMAQDQARTPDPAGSDAAQAPATVVVTAQRAPTPADQVGQSVTVLTLPQIRADQETQVSDILARTPGVTFSRNGGPGETTSLYIRGADADQTVVLIDGVKVNDPTSTGGGFDFADLVTGDIARIEVLRGSQSTLYGSQAIGGVVNILTADATKPVQGDLQLEGGSYGTAYAKGGVGGKGDRYDWRIGAYYQTTDSVSAFDRAFGGREDDGFHSAGASGRFRYALTPDLQLDERVYYSYAYSKFDGYSTPTYSFGDDPEYGRSQQVIDYTGLNWSTLEGRLKNRFSYQYTEINRRNEDPSQLDYADTKQSFDAVGRVNTFDYEGTFAITQAWRAVFGAQTERSTLDSISPLYDAEPLKAHDTINSGYGQLTGEVLPGLTLTGGLRYDDHSTYGGHTTGQASGAWKLNGGATILRASYGGGFKAPSLYQLYSDYGTPSLKPETSDSWDAGIEQHLFGDRVTVQATYFGRKTRNLIEFADCPGAGDGCVAQPYGFYLNVARAEAEGVELQGDWRVSDAFSLAANYTYDDAQNKSADRLAGHDQLARRPRNAANLSATYVWPGKLTTTAAVRYAGKSFDSESSDHVLGAYTLLDLRASYPLRDDLELYGRIENLTDERYETTYQYGTLGRAAYGGVRLSF